MSMRVEIWLWSDGRALESAKRVLSSCFQNPKLTDLTRGSRKRGDISSRLPENLPYVLLSALKNQPAKFSPEENQDLLLLTKLRCLLGLTPLQCEQRLSHNRRLIVNFEDALRLLGVQWAKKIKQTACLVALGMSCYRHVQCLPWRVGSLLD